MTVLTPARLRVADLMRVGLSGLRARPLRAVLSSLGIAIGIAAMTAVVGISSSSRADLDRALAALGTNLLTVGPGNTMFGDDATLPDESVSMIERIGPVRAVAATGTVRATRGRIRVQFVAESLLLSLAGGPGECCWDSR